MMHSLRQLDEKMDEKMLRTLKVAHCLLSASPISLHAECLPHCMPPSSLRTSQEADEALDLLFEAYAGAMYPHEPPEDAAEDAKGAEGAPDLRIDRAELIHLLQVIASDCV